MKKSRFSHDVIVVGGGAAGLSTASGCAQLGMKTALIEKNHTGGDCLYHGCVPSKTLLHSAAVLQHARDAQQFGLSDALQITDTPDITRINRRIASVISTIEPHDSPDRFRSLGAEVFIQSAHFVDAHTLQLDDKTELSAPRIVLATGSRPREIPIPGLADTGYITNLDLFSLAQLPKSLVVIGGGPIGLEMSQALLRLGVAVTIVEAAEHLLPSEDADMAAVVQQRIELEGARVISGSGVQQVETVSDPSAGTQRKRVILTDGTAVEAEEILLAIGRIGNTEGLAIENAGVVVERGFFPVDEKLRTNQKHILAIGDCNGKYLFTHVAGTEASVAVRRLALHLPAKMKYDKTPWCTYTEPELASVGFNEKRARQAGIHHTIAAAEFDHHDRALAEGETAGKLKMLLDRKQRVIGVQIVGPHAGELLLTAVFAVHEGWKISRFLAPVYPYPTLSEIYKVAAGSVLAPQLFNARIRRILRLLFGYRGRGPASKENTDV